MGRFVSLCKSEKWRQIKSNTKLENPEVEISLLYELKRRGKETPRPWTTCSVIIS